MAGLAFSCDKVDFKETAVDDSSLENPGVQPSVEQITISAYLPEDGVMKGGTKVAITEAGDYSKAELAWEAGDQITIVSTGTPVTATLGISSIDGKKAEFSGPAPVGTAPYTIFYHRSKPLTIEKFESITCDGQVQDGNGSTAHLQYGMKLEGVNAYQSLTFSQEWAAANSEGGTGTITQNSVLQMILKLPDGVGEVYSIYVHDDGSFKQTLWLTDGANLFASPTAGHIIKAYMMVPDMDLASGNLTVRVETEDGAYEAAYPLTTTDWTGGAQYTVQKNMSGLSAVTGEHAAMEIHAKSAQDILQFKEGVAADNARFKASNVVLESDIDMSSAGTWSASVPDTFAGTFGSASALEKKKISGFSATAPLFAIISKNATVQNFILNGSFIFTAPNASDNFGSLAKQLKGSLSNVTVNANISLAGVAREAWLDVGGLVGRVNGSAASFENCCYNGNIEVPSSYSTSNSNGLRIGGLIGYVTAAITITGSSFGGTLKCEGGVSAAATDPTVSSNHPALCVGGIVGKLQNGTISGCTTTDALDASKPKITVDKTDYKGAIFIKSSTYNSVAVGGIAGFCYDGSASVSGCTNATSILTNVTTADAANIYLFSGGIVGLNRQNVTACTNNGVQQHFSTSRLLSIGGIIGRDYGTLTVSTGISNTGATTVYSSPTSASYQIAIGGIIGFESVAIDGGNISLLSNSGSITQKFNGIKSSASASASNAWSIFLGGIVGYSTHGVSNASNSGNIEFICNHVGTESEEGGADLVHMGGIAGKVYASELEDLAYCTNSGNLTFNPTSTAPHHNGKSGTDAAVTYAKYSHNYIGGIVGYAYLANIKGDNTNKSTNSGTIFGGDGSGNNNTAETFWVGGIVGRLEGASSSISYCELSGTGKVNNNHFSNKGYASYCPMGGGIAGEVLGNSSNHASVSNCTISSQADIIARRGQCGGILGYARYTDISDCTVPISFGNSAYCYGGIVGWLRDGEVSSSTFSGSSIRSSQLTVGGGIVGRLQVSTIDGCSSSASDISKNGVAIVASGGIAGESVAVSTIKNTHRKTTMNICPDANWTDGDGNVADL